MLISVHLCLLQTLAFPKLIDQDVEVVKIDVGKRCNSKYSIASVECNFAACQAMCTCRVWPWSLWTCSNPQFSRIGMRHEACKYFVHWAGAHGAGSFCEICRSWDVALPSVNYFQSQTQPTPSAFHLRKGLTINPPSFRSTTTKDLTVLYEGNIYWSRLGPK